MAYSTGRQQCTMDGSCKQAAVFTCRGCGKNFCSKHVSSHRQALSEQLGPIVTEHDQLKATFSQHTSNPNLHPLMKQIDEWEKKSIEKIQLKAKEAREQLLEPTTIQINQLSKRIASTTDQIIKARELDDFVETDLATWTNKLTLLKYLLISPTRFGVIEEEVPLVRNMSVIIKTINEKFERTFDGKVDITEDGEVAIHGVTSGFTEIQGKNEYSSGCHKIRLRIESLNKHDLLLGINSKQTALRHDSYLAKSAYLWYSNNYMYVNGSRQDDASRVRIEMNKYDIITLIFDCDNKEISMINERTKAQHDLDVNIEHCPFPWQLHINMHNANESVRILPS